MKEVSYRASRIFKALGNPLRLSIIEKLSKTRMTPGQLSEELKRPISTISGHLSILRSLDILRFETSGENVWYWIKHEEIVELVELAMECVVNIQMKR